MIRNLLLALLPLLAAVGCTRRTLYAPDTEAFEVRFQAAGLEISASASQITKGTLPEGTLNIAVYQGSVFILQKAYTVTAEGAITPTDGTVLELTAGDYDFYAYGPQAELDTEEMTVEGIAHGTDLIAAQAMEQTVADAGKKVTLNFEHLASKVSFGVTGSSEVSVTSLDATKLTLAEMATSPATYTLGAPLTPTRGSATANTYIIDEFTQAEDGKSTSAGGIVLPKAEGTFGLVANVLLNGEALELAAVVPSIAFEAGKHYSFTAEVMKKAIRLKLTVLDWTEAKYTEDGTGDVMVVGSWELIDAEEPDLGHGVGVGFTVGAWTAAKYAEDGTGQMMTVKEWEKIYLADLYLGAPNPPANSYMITPGGSFQFYATVRGNGGDNAGTGLSTEIAPASIRLVWQDTPGLITNASTIPLVDGVATVQTAAGTNGNAVIAAYSGANGTGNILWSWHIWVTDYAPVGQAYVSANVALSVTNGQVHTYGTNYMSTNPGKVIMDRNLGATYSGNITGPLSSADAPKAYGMYYQWGRKDPMGRWNGSVGSSALAPMYNAAGSAVTFQSVSLASSVGDAIQNLTTFYRTADMNASSYSYDWLSSGDWGSSRLWGNGGAKTIFDPCPAGWKVPKGSGTWSDFTRTSASSGTFLYYINGTQTETNSGGLTTRNGRLYVVPYVMAWYPATGQYDGSSVSNGGSAGYYWGVSASYSNSGMNFGNNSVSSGYGGMAFYGQSVRCIQE